MNKFTVEEINFMCVFETQNRMKMMEEIRRIMPYIKDSDMEDLSRQVLRKYSGSEWVVSCNGWLPAFLIWQIFDI